MCVPVYVVSVLFLVLLRSRVQCCDKVTVIFFTESGTMLFVTFSYVFLQIRTIDRNMEIPHKGAFCDILLDTTTCSTVKGTQSADAHAR